jgi:hypothetical protein
MKIYSPLHFPLLFFLMVLLVWCLMYCVSFLPLRFGPRIIACETRRRIGQVSVIAGSRLSSSLK